MHLCLCKLGRSIEHDFISLYYIWLCLCVFLCIHNLLLCSPKYGITEQRTGYKGVMKLTVRSFSSSDVGTYHCVSTNSLGRAEGTLRLYGKSPNTLSIIEVKYIMSKIMNLFILKKSKFILDNRLQIMIN